MKKLPQVAGVEIGKGRTYGSKTTFPEVIKEVASCLPLTAGEQGPFGEAGVRPPLGQSHIQEVWPEGYSFQRERPR